MTSAPQAPTRNVLYLLASSREGGNSEQLARRAAEALPPNTRRDWLVRPLADPERSAA